MSTPNVINFYARLDSAKPKVDITNGMIRGVSLITGGITAKGHELDVDDETLGQILSLATKMGKVPVKADHGSGVMHVCGYLTNFRREGNKVVGDWKLLRKHTGYEQILETAQEQPETVGLSVSFVSPDEPFIGLDGRAKARATELLSTDYVVHPAANPNGLFSRKFASRSGAIRLRDSNNQSGKHPFAPKIRSQRSEIGIRGVRSFAMFDRTPHHFAAIQEAINFIRVPGPIRRPERAGPQTSGAQPTRSSQARNPAGQFTDRPRSSPEMMRKAYGGNIASRLRASRLALRRATENRNAQ